MNEDETGASSSEEWLDALDAVIAAPLHHKVLLETGRVRVLDTLIKSGDKTPVHTHRWSCVHYILSIGDFVRYDADGKVVFDSRRSPFEIKNEMALWSQPLPPHSVKNVGDAELRVISVELKD